LELGLEGLGVLSIPHVFFHQETTTTCRQALAQGNQGESS
jgi:hypothetical protein